MQRSLLFALLATLLLVGGARAETDPDYSMVLLTENFPPYNMAINGKNFAQGENIDGIAVDIVREMFKRAGVQYSLTLRFPWDRIYRLTLDKPNYGLFSTTYTDERKPLFKWVGPLAKSEWVLLAAPGSTIKVGSLEEAAKYKIGAYKNDAVSQHLESKGLKPDNSLRDQENVAKLISNANTPKMGYLDPAAYERTIKVLMAGGSAPVIKKDPGKAAMTHLVWEQAAK